MSSLISTWVTSLNSAGVTQANIAFIFETLEVLKFERSNEVNPKQFANIALISVTLSVLKFSERIRLESLTQDSNIADIVVTFCVLKLDKLSSLKFIHILNIKLMSVTLLVLNDERSMLLKESDRKSVV